jgi:hypothetical protein
MHPRKQASQKTKIPTQPCLINYLQPEVFEGTGFDGRIYNRHMENGRFFPIGFSAAIISAGSRTRQETLEAGIPVFYRDWKRNLDVMEQPDGRKFGFAS